MEQAREFYANIQELDRRRLISLDWLKRWIVCLLIVFVTLNYIWSSLFSNLKDSHIPFALLPPELQYKELRMPYRTADEIRKSQINQINFVIFSCTPIDDSNDTDSLQHTVQESLRTMKSATLFTKRIIHFHIFTEDILYQTFIAELDRWPYNILHRVTFEFHAATYPESILEESLRHDKTCDLSFLFMPSIVKDLDFAIYAKSGAIFLSSIDQLWMNFRDYSNENALALPLNFYNGISHMIDTAIPLFSVEPVYDLTVIQFDILRLQTALFSVPSSRKTKFATQPWFPLNTNEFEIVNLTWSPYMLLTLYKTFKPILTTPGVDLLNIIALFNPHKVFSLSCEWNFDVNSCQNSMHQCPTAKLVVNNAVGDYSYNREFEELCTIFDVFNLKNQNLTHLKHDLQMFNQRVYRNWPSYNVCSLRNVDLICKEVT